MPITPKMDTEAKRSILCVGGTTWEKAFPQNFYFPLTRACTTLCDDVERFGELLCIHREWSTPSDTDLRQLGDVRTIRWLFIVSEVRFPLPYHTLPPAARAHVGQSGLFIREHFEDQSRKYTRKTTFTCYVLLNDSDEKRLYDHFKDFIFAIPPILVFGFQTKQFVLPKERIIDEGKQLDPYQCFIPADEVIMKFY